MLFVGSLGRLRWRNLKLGQPKTGTTWDWDKFVPVSCFLSVVFPNQVASVLSLLKNVLCWEFRNAAQTILFRFSCILKIAKMGAVKSALMKSPKFLPVLRVVSGWEKELVKLLLPNYSRRDVSSVGLPVINLRLCKSKLVCLPYFHAVSHNLKPIASGLVVTRVF